MSFERERTGDHYQVLQREPLVAAGAVDSSAAVPLLAEALSTLHPDVVFVGIVTADDGDDVGSIIDGLGPHVAEMIFTASTSPVAIAGLTLAERALNEFGVGQDFVFTVPALSEAILYALTQLADHRNLWDGTAILVAGSPATIEEVRRQLRSMP